MSEAQDLLPPPHPALEWRLLNVSDSQLLYGLVGELEEDDQALFRTSLSEAAEMLDRPEAAAVVGGFESAEGPTPSVLAAFGYVGLARSGKPEAICHGGVVPRLRGRGIGESLLVWQTETGRSFLLQAFPDAVGHIVHSVDARRSSFHSHLETLGYRWRHSYAELRHDLQDLPQTPPVPAYVEIVPWSAQWEELSRKAYNRAAKHAGQSERISAEQWVEARAHLVPEWSFIAVDRSRDRAKVVGLVEVGRYAQDWNALGWQEGYIDTVAVFDPAMRATLLPALLSSAMQAISAAGLDKAAVGLDPQEDPDMMDFYTKTGFHPHAWWRNYALVVRGEDSD